ncbi:MAG: two-component system response regulator [Bacteroidetes bacterium GWA2_40_14]|jgi:CheY-like chemotaxis protein|nr:MAG: two-component system response regulator [Bacteroidetes bacterium GWA2_40_14]
MKANIKNILLVDDNENDVILVKSALQGVHFGNKIIVAEDGEEALDFLYKRGKFIDNPIDLPIFILLDIKMPLMDGIEVLKIIRADTTFNNIPIIMLTSSRDSNDLQECYDHGANSFVVKPVDIADFIKVVKELGQYWVVINEQPN